MKKRKPRAESPYNLEDLFEVWEKEKSEEAKKCLKDKGFEEDDCLACDNYEHCTEQLLLQYNR